jgi:hypothetical protein
MDAMFLVTEGYACRLLPDNFLLGLLFGPEVEDNISLKNIR